jgi:hypothetical protein
MRKPNARHPIPMPRPSIRHPIPMLAMLTVVVSGLLTAQASASPAMAQTSGAAAACTGTKGVTVVVDFTKLSGKIKTACDPTDPKTGLAALTGAGFSYTFVPRVPGFVCTIDKLPDPCNGAPTTAYWSYWHAKPHGKWVYSTLGAGSYHPAAGSVQGWAFGSGQAPGITPP